LCLWVSVACNTLKQRATVRYEKCSPGSSNLISAITLSIGAILVKLLRVEVGGLSGVLVFPERYAT
jgi:hypothetical protein